MFVLSFFGIFCMYLILQVKANRAMNEKEKGV